MFQKKVKQEIERLRWKIQSLENQNKDLKGELERAIQTLRKQMIAQKKGVEISEQAILEGLPFDLISGEEAIKLNQQNPDTVFLDVRTEMEFHAGYIPGASHIPIDQLHYRIQELEAFKEQPVVAYCASGSRAEVACQILADQGFQRVFHLQGGLGAYPDSLEQSKSQNKISAPVRSDTEKKPEEINLQKKVQKVLDEAINPAVASHGGVIELLDVIDQDIYVRMGGGCQGCSSATATLKQGVEEMLRREIPEIGSLYDTTDHAAGKNPYFSA